MRKSKLQNTEAPPPIQRLASIPRGRRRDLLIGITCGCAVVLLFSGFTLISRLGMRSMLGPSDLAALRFGTGGLLRSILVCTRAVTAFGASQTALMSTAVPCVTALAAMPVLGEYPSAPALAGVAAVSLGMTTAVLETNRLVARRAS